MRESQEYERKSRVPVKAAPDHANCSVFGDDLVIKVRNMITKEGNRERADQVLRKTFHNIKAIQVRYYSDN